MKTVRKSDRRPIEDMLYPMDCSHDRIYEGRKGWWYCADCPDYAWKKDYFDKRKVNFGKFPHKT